MATNTDERPQLKYLGFVRDFRMIVVVFILRSYQYAKEHSGPFKYPIGLVESILCTFVGPVYRRVKGLPDYFLAFYDNLVDRFVKLFERLAPTPVKLFVSQALHFGGMAFEVGRTFVSKALADGLSTAIKYAIAELQKFITSLFLNLSLGVLKFSPFRDLAGFALPGITGVLDRYNQGINKLAEKGFTSLGNLPTFPTDVLSNALKQGGKLGKGINDITESATGKIGDALKQGTEGITNIAESATGKIGDVIKQGSDGITNIAESATGKIGDVIKQGPLGITNIAESATGKIGDVIKQGPLGITNIAESATGKIGDVIKQGPLGITNIAESATGKIGDVIKQGPHGITNIAESATGKIDDVFKQGENVAQGFTNIAGTAAGNISDTVKETEERLTGGVSKIVGAATGLIPSVVKDAGDVGEALKGFNPFKR